MSLQCLRKIIFRYFAAFYYFYERVLFNFVIFHHGGECFSKLTARGSNISIYAAYIVLRSQRSLRKQRYIHNLGWETVRSEPLNWIDFVA